MVNYRRNRIPGGTYFFTVTLADRRSTFLIDKIDLLRTAIQRVKSQRPFQIGAMVVLPDHLHAVWTLPQDDDDYPSRWRSIKSVFTQQTVKAGHHVSRNRKGEYRLWQRRYWEHTITDEADLQRHVDYIHYNPVKHSLVSRVVDWPYSSFHRYVRRGWLNEDWGGEAAREDEGCFGE